MHKILILFIGFFLYSTVYSQCTTCSPGGTRNFTSNTTITSSACYTSASMDNNKEVTIQSGATLTICGNFTGSNGNGITVNSGGTLIITGMLDIANTFALISNGSVTIGSIDLDNNGALTVQGSGTLSVTGNVTTSQNATINVSSGGTFQVTGDLSVGTGTTIISSGILAVSGTISGTVPPTSAVQYRSKATGNWNSNTTWESSTNGTSWSAATATPISDNDTITIRNGHNVSVTASVIVDEVIVNLGGTLTINSGQTLTIANGAAATDCQVNGTLSNVGVVTTTGALTFGSTGVYTHAQNGGVIPTATWSTGSTCNVTGMTGTAPSGLNQNFHHVTWNSTGQTIDFNINASPTWGGDFTITSTGTKVFGVSAGTTSTLTVSGNVAINGGTLILSNSGTVGGALSVAGNITISNSAKFYTQAYNWGGTLTVTGNVTTSGTATFMGADLNYNSNSTWNLYGNVDIASGTVGARSGTANSGFTTINLYGSGKTFKLPTASRVYNENAYWAINIKNNAVITLQSDIYLGRTMTVETGGTLVLGIYIIQNMTSSAFTTQSGSTIKTANTGGIVTVATGNSGAVQTATRTFNSAATYEYNGTAAQVTGTGLPTPLTTPGGLVINNTEAISSSSTGVTLTQASTVSSGTVTLTNGILTTTSNLLTITNTATTAIIRANSAYVNGPLSWSLASGSSTYLFPVGKGGNYYPFTFSNPAGTLPVLKVEANASNCGGSALTLSTTEYWKVDYSGTSVTGGIVKLERPTAISPLNIVATSATSNGVYSSLLASSSTSTSVTATNSVGTVTGLTRFYTFAACTDNIYYVSTSGSDGNAGTSSGTAFATLQKAIDMAGCGSTNINVAAGTYIQDDITINNKSNITIIGAGISSTIFDGDFGNRFMAISGTSSNISISNMKIMEMDELSVHTTYSGGGLYITASGTVNVTSVYFYKCKCSTNGGSGGGGAIYNSSASSLNLYKCKFSDNEDAINNSTQDGSAICNIGTIHIENSLFYANNHYADYDGTIVFKAGGDGTIVNSTIIGTIPIYIQHEGAGSTVTLLNSILKGSVGGYDIRRDNNPTVNNINCIGYTGNLWFGTQTNCTTTTDYGFTNLATNDYTLSSSSYCKDKGTSSIISPVSLTAPTNDFTGASRSGNPDVGCYEVISASTITLALNTVSVANNCASSTKVPIQSFILTPSAGNGNLTNIGFTTTGTYVQADITKYQLWYGASSSIGSAAQLGADLTSSGGSGARTFAVFTSPTLTSSTPYYFWITIDVASGATNNNTIAVNAITTSDLTSTSTKAGTTSSGGNQTLNATSVGGTATSTAATICTGASTTISLSGNTGSTIQWQLSSDGSTGWANVTLGSGATTATYTTSNLTATTYYRAIVTSGVCTASNSATATVTVNSPMSTSPLSGDIIWVGTSTSWGTSSNWLTYNGSLYSIASSAPTSSNRVIISAVNSCVTAQPTLAADFSIGDFIIETGATFNQSSYILTVGGSFTNNGTYNAGTGTLILNGSSAQTVSGNTTTFNNVIINKTSGGVTLGVSTTVLGTLTLTSGKLNVQGVTLTIGSATTDGFISGGTSSSSYIVVYDAVSTIIGYVKHFVNADNIVHSYPIGDLTSYAPLTFKLTGHSSSLSGAYFTVYTKNVKVPGLNATFSSYLKRYWEGVPNGMTSPTYTISYVYADVDISGGETNLKPVKKSGTTWYKPSGATFTTGQTQGSSTLNADLNTLTWSGLTTFSAFGAAGNQAVALPIETVLFKGEKSENGNVLTWHTNSESQNDFFTIEKTLDGKHFEVLGVLNGAGNSHQMLDYLFIDNNFGDEMNYYRLSQTDFDGFVTTMDLVSINNKRDKLEKVVAYETNILGQEIDEFYRGLVIIVYTDGSTMKVIREPLKND